MGWVRRDEQGGHKGERAKHLSCRFNIMGFASI